MLKKVLCTLCLLTLPLSAAAEEEELAPGFRICMEKSGGVTMAMQDCLNEAYNYWDHLLNANYKKAKAACDEMSGDPKQCRDKLLKAERAWIKYRDGMADVVWELNGGGTFSGVAAMDFLATETKKQAKLLDVQY